MEWKRAVKKIYRNLSPRWDCFPFGGRQAGVGDMLTSIYFSNFPDRCKVMDLFKLFGCVGEVVEVVIPPKLNKFGKRFGFARFKEVEDGRMMAVRLDNILIGGNKIYANQPRFQRSGRKVRVDEERKNTGSRKEEGQVFAKHRVDESRSFADIVMGGSKKKVVKEDEFFLSFTSGEELKNKWKKAFIGEVLFPGEAYNIQTHLEIEGFFSIKVHPLGANLCLLEEMEEGIIKELIEEGKWWWQQWFKSLKPWQENDVDMERVMWIRIYGVPCHAWCSEFFESVANKLGSFVCLDENTMTGNSMDIARCLVRVNATFILPEIVQIVIDGKSFVLNLREDTYGPLRITAQKDLGLSIKSSSLSSSSSKAASLDLTEEEDGEFIPESLMEPTDKGRVVLHRVVEDVQKQKKEPVKVTAVIKGVCSELSESSDKFLNGGPRSKGPEETFDGVLQSLLEDKKKKKGFKQQLLELSSEHTLSDPSSSTRVAAAMFLGLGEKEDRPTCVQSLISNSEVDRDVGRDPRNKNLALN
ncbi:uncharacterized protein LOC131639233 [Vicia villosa]|uniref:uncharacterized protein LOC131639233 n=1 Tax=Vicia villosa TaxID=3911 RepID=UPI00273AF72D|nr:uncharacterized protein LOC131639233 [Vicia villosa]